MKVNSNKGTKTAENELCQPSASTCHPVIDMGPKRMPATAKIKEFEDVFNQFGDEQEQRVAKATAEMLQRLENDEVIAPAEKEFERAQEVERAFEKDFDGLDSA